MGDCWWQTRGCTDSTAVNYNIEASIDDNSCIQTKLGCTVNDASYHGVEPGTPSYKGRWIGIPLRHVGRTQENSPVEAAESWQYSNVLNYDATANVLHGCVVTLEGCMDSTAVNYDSHANRNTNTWCVPPVIGCMMPSHDAPKDNYEDNTGPRTHQRDGLAINYLPSATVNDPYSCIIERYGCMSSTALNYDSHATINWQCWEPYEGCLDPAADNYNCSVEAFTQCVGANARPDTVTRVSVHSSAICVYAKASPALPPPSPARPPMAPKGAIATSFSVKIDVIIDATMEEFDTARKAKKAAEMCASLNLATSQCVLDVVPASVKLTYTITTDTEAESDTAAAKARTDLATPASASSFLGLRATEGATVTQLQTYSIINAPPSPPPGPDWPAIIGGSVGGVLGFFLIIGIAYMMKKRANTKVEA
jgi:hypothetical protein